MSMFKVFDISGSAVSAQSQRLNVVASNLANVDTVAGPDGSAYKARQVVFQTVMMDAQGRVGSGQIGDPVAASAGVKVSTVSEDNTPGRKVRDPSHPAADADGYGCFARAAPSPMRCAARAISRRRACCRRICSTTGNRRWISCSAPMALGVIWPTSRRSICRG